MKPPPIAHKDVLPVNELASLPAAEAAAATVEIPQDVSRGKRSAPGWVEHLAWPPFLVLVVDDGSTDQTGELARGAGANVIRHSVPAGKGAALRSGFSEAWGLGFRWVLALDGDGQHMPADIPRFFQCASKTDARMVIGNC